MFPKKVIIDKLIFQAQQSQMLQKLSACVVSNGKMLTPCCSNVQRNSCRGAVLGSLHAEANAVMNYYGRNLKYSPKYGWYIFQQERGKCVKEKC
jgi:hypothetical protein